MKKHGLWLYVLLLSLVIITSCVHSNNDKQNEEEDVDYILSESEIVTIDEAERIINANKGKKGFILLDVRTNAEFKEGYLKGHLEKTKKTPYKGVLQHDYYANDFREWVLNLNKEKRYLIYCRTDNRSSETFKILKAAGFQKIQYMKDGYTGWVTHKKPVIIPPYKKALDLHIKGDKIKTDGTIRFEFHLTNLDDDPARKGKISLKFLHNGTTEILKEDAKVNDNGDFSKTFDMNGHPKGSYRLICEANHEYLDAKGQKKEYIPVEAYYDFEFTTENVNVTGDHSEIEIKKDEDINAKMAEKFYNRNIYGYKVYNRNSEVLSLGKPVVADKPTLVIFISPKCDSCMVNARELDTYKLDSITLIPVITSIDESNLGQEIANTETTLKNDKNKLDSMVPIALYDAKDYIWGSRFKFGATPKFVLINKEGQIKDIIHGSKEFKIEALLEKMETKFNLPKFQKK